MDGFPLFRAALGWILCLRQTQTLGLNATMQNHQASPPNFQSAILPCDISQRCQWYKWIKAMLHFSNILTHGQPRFKGAKWIGQPRTSSEFSGHGSCANKDWQKSDRKSLICSRAPNTDWPPLLPVESLNESTNRGIVIFPWLLLLKHRNTHLQRGRSIAKTRPDMTRSDIWPCSPVLTMLKGLCCSAGVVMGTWHGPQWC